MSSLHNPDPNHKELVEWVQVTYPFLLLHHLYIYLIGNRTMFLSIPSDVRLSDTTDPPIKKAAPSGAAQVTPSFNLNYLR
jgi:hypothetical protein